MRGGIDTSPALRFSVRVRERVDERVEIEQLAHVGFVEEDHDRRLSRPSAC